MFIDFVTNPTRRWTVQDYASTISAMVANQGRFTHVLLASDDKSTYTELPEQLKKPVSRAGQPEFIRPFPLGGESLKVSINQLPDKLEG